MGGFKGNCEALLPEQCSLGKIINLTNVLQLFL